MAFVAPPLAVSGTRDRFEFRERRQQSLARTEIGHPLEVADQAEVQPPAVAERRDPESLVREERQVRMQIDAARAPSR